MPHFPATTKSIFIGRKQEFEAFEQLRETDDIRLLNIHSEHEGGLGKTQLALRFCQKLMPDESPVPSSEALIDMQDTRCRSKIGILQRIADCLDVTPL